VAVRPIKPDSQGAYLLPSLLRMANRRRKARTRSFLMQSMQSTKWMNTVKVASTKNTGKGGNPFKLLSKRTERKAGKISFSSYTVA